MRTESTKYEVYNFGSSVGKKLTELENVQDSVHIQPKDRN